MCGIYGYIGKPTRRTRKVIRLLGLYNQSRGTDSSGVAIAKPDDFNLIKQVGNSYRLFNNTEVLREISNESPYLNIIGHTRRATTGAINWNNAHPYIYGDIIYAHNGIINNFWSLEKELEQEYAVDSQVIGELLDTLGERKTFEKKLDGWYAIPYLNLATPYELRLIRHDAPISVAITHNRQGMYYSSESRHLMKALRRAKIKAPLNILGEDILYSFRYAGELSWTRQRYEIPKTKYYYSGYNTYQTNKAWSENKAGFNYGDEYDYDDYGNPSWTKKPNNKCNWHKPSKNQLALYRN